MIIQSIEYLKIYSVLLEAFINGMEQTRESITDGRILSTEEIVEKLEEMCAKVVKEL